jgi:hypothetical protein
MPVVGSASELGLSVRDHSWRTDFRAPRVVAVVCLAMRYRTRSEVDAVSGTEAAVTVWQGERAPGIGENKNF